MRNFLKFASFDIGTSSKKLSGTIVVARIATLISIPTMNTASAAASSISMETSSGSYTTARGVNLGSLASRTKSSAQGDTSWPLTKSSTSPYTITGTLSGGSSYQYQTLTNYTGNNLYEGVDRTTLASGSGTINGDLATGWDGSNTGSGQGFKIETNQSTSGVSAGGNTLTTKTGTYKLSSFSSI